jgi:hypothetical protein
MKALIFLLLLLPFHAQAGSLAGFWEGPGKCFLEGGETKACTVRTEVLFLPAGRALHIQHCSQDDGSPVVVCFTNQFTLENGNEIWVDSKELGKTKVGSFSPESISFRLTYADLTVEESFELSGEEMSYSVNYSSAGISLLNETGKLRKNPFGRM